MSSSCSLQKSRAICFCFELGFVEFNYRMHLNDVLFEFRLSRECANAAAKHIATGVKPVGMMDSHQYNQ